MQVPWPEGDFRPATKDTEGKLNFGLFQETFLAKRFFMCSNFCGPCEFEGAANGYFTTMHWFFKNTMPGGKDIELCGNDEPIPNCREGDWAGIPPLKLISFFLAKKYLSRLLFAVGGGVVSFFVLKKN